MSVSVPKLGLQRHAFTYEMHPGTNEMVGNLVTWGETINLAPALGEGGDQKVAALADVSAKLAGRAAPHLSGQDSFILAKQIFWLYGFDAIADGEVDHQPKAFWEAFRSRREVIGNPNPNQYKKYLSPFTYLLGSLAVDVRQMCRSNHEYDADAAAGQFNAYRTAIEDYMGGVEEEMFRLKALREHGTMPTLREYVQMRRHTSGVGVVLSLIEPMESLPLTDEMRRSSLFRAITDAGVDLIAWDNDLVSLRKEKEAGQADVTLVPVLQHQRAVLEGRVAYDEQDAVNEAVEMRNEKEAELIGIRDALSGEGANHALSRYVGSVVRWAQGHLEFVDTHPRYQ